MSEQDAGDAAKDQGETPEEQADQPEAADQTEGAGEAAADPEAAVDEAAAAAEQVNEAAETGEADAAAGGEGESDEAEPVDPQAQSVLDAMREAINAVESGESATEAQAVAAAAAEELSLPDFMGQSGSSELPGGIQLISDVNLKLKVELGRTRMHVDDVLKLGEGSVVELDKLAGDPVDIYVNDRPVARGEVLVLNENFCVRINEVLPSIAGDEEERGAA